MATDHKRNFALELLRLLNERIDERSIEAILRLMKRYEGQI